MDFCYKRYLNFHWYDIYECFVPSWIIPRIELLNSFFKECDKDIPLEYKRRKSPLESIESSIMLLGRLEQMMVMDIPLVAGSRYLNDRPWATFGGTSHCNAKHHFLTFEDLCNNYHDKIVSTECVESVQILFRKFPFLPLELSQNNKKTCPYILALAILVACDILYYCGPDCPDLQDFFCNDTREKIPDIDKWKKTREKLFKNYNNVSEKPKEFHIGQIGEELQLVSNTYITEIYCDKIEDGENILESENINDEDSPEELIKLIMEQLSD